jgi:hypothetical protein
MALIGLGCTIPIVVDLPAFLSTFQPNWLDWSEPTMSSNPATDWFGDQTCD